MPSDVTTKAYARAQAVDVSAIPVIDFAPFLTGDPAAKLAVAKRIGDACETVGFLYLKGHGVPEALIDGVFTENRRLFAQSFEDRMRTAATLDHWRGYVPSKLEGEGGATGGSIETFRAMLDLPWDDPDVVAGKPLHLPNRWPDHLPGFQRTVSAYIDAMLDLGARLRAAFALALDLPEDYFEPFYRKPLIQLSLLHYRPPKSLSEEDFEIGAGEHQDTGAFTILMQDDTGGLEVGHKDLGWVAAPPIAGAYVINIGDMMMHWTNGRFRSTPHRVVNRSLKPRYSVPFFMNPDFDVVVEPEPRLFGPGETARYAPLHNGRFMVDFYDAGMAYLKDHAV